MSQQRIAIVTGCARGVGAGNLILFMKFFPDCQVKQKLLCSEIAAHFKHNRWHVIGADVRIPTGGNSNVSEMHMLDVSRPEALVNFARMIGAAHPYVHCLVNNAALMMHDFEGNTPMIEQSIEMYDRIMNVNVRGPFVFTQAMHPLLAKTPNATVINCIRECDEDTEPIIAASQTALKTLTTRMSEELYDYGIRCNALVTNARFKHSQAGTEGEMAAVAKVALAMANENGMKTEGEREASQF